MKDVKIQQTMIFLLIIVLIFLIVPTKVNAEEGIDINSDNFPDENFRRYVSNTIDRNKDDKINSNEIDNTSEINVNNSSITDLAGIEFFTKLDRLYCQNNQLTKLDLSNNTEIYVLACDSNKLTEVDVTKCVELGDFSCSSNKLTELDITNNPKIYQLACSINKIKKLNLSNNFELDNLACDSNQLTKLDVSNNNKIHYLACGINNINELDLSNNIELKSLNCQSNNLTSLDLSNNINLTDVWCNFNQLTSLNVSNNSKLNYIDCDDQSYNIFLNENNEFNLSTLPGTFEVGKTSNWVGGSVSNNVLKASRNTVTYKYDVGNNKNKMQVKLNVVHPCVLSFNSNGGSEVSNQVVANGNLAIEPTPPIREDYIFDGWYLDALWNEPFDFNMEIKTDYVLNAKWIHINHEWGEEKVSIPATCTEVGEKIYYCTVCDTTKTESIPKLGHNWNDWIVTKEATFTEEGTKTRTCKNDTSHIETEVIPKLFQIGDVNGDRKVNITDVALINAHVKKTKTLEGEELYRADVNDDGKVNITDVALVNAHVKKVKLLF